MKNKQIDEEQLDEVIKDLEDKLVIVEGKMDKKALKTLGLKDIIAIDGMPFYMVAEIASDTEKEIVILTDFDSKGRQLEKKLRHLLQKRGKHSNTRIRCKVMALGKNKIEDFGGLHIPENVSFEEDDFHVKAGTDIDKIRGKGGNRRAGSNRKA